MADFRSIILPMSFPATSTVILLSLISGLRSFDLIWATTGGGPGFASDVIASVIYKQYQAGFYGLSTAGNVHAVHRGHGHHLPAVALAELEGGGTVNADAHTGARWLARRRGIVFSVDHLPGAVRLHLC